MAIPNVRRVRISKPDGTDFATIMAVVPKGTDMDAYAVEAAQRYDWKSLEDAKKRQFKVRIGQQKQKKAK